MISSTTEYMCFTCVTNKKHKCLTYQITVDTYIRFKALKLINLNLTEYYEQKKPFDRKQKAPQ